MIVCCHQRHLQRSCFSWCRLIGSLGAVIFLGLGAGPSNWVRANDRDRFENHIRPLLTKNCLPCHGAAKQEAGLNLSRWDSLLQGGDSGAAVVPGQPDASLLIDAVEHRSLQMPPDKKLENQQIEQLRAWISQGAPWPTGQTLLPADQLTGTDRQWWCIQPVVDYAVPKVDDSNWCQNEIDYFIAERLQAAGLKPAPRALQWELYRRVHYALSGLPPEFRSELDQASPEMPESGWYAELVDQLLDASSYGEHQARYWLDLVRYADSDGYRADAVRPAAMQYRDYVIAAFQQDRPYDRFILEQLAGDEIDPENRQAIVGTMFLRHWIYEHNQRDVQGQWQEILDDVTETTADVFLALGIKCARCHDHKFDPLLQKDFFRLQAYFAALHPREDLPVATPIARQEYQQQWDDWQAATQEIRIALRDLELPVLLKHATREGFDKFVPEIKAMILKRSEERTPWEHQIATLAERQYDLTPEKLPQWLDAASEKRRQELLQELANFDALKPQPLPTQSFVATDVGPTAPPTFIHGDRQKTPVEPGPPTILDPLPAQILAPHPALKSTGRRTALARWIASAQNPLTARVIVNRLWQQHFGVGLVENASDFGRLGQPPSHPELLDWLACRFIEDGWSIKRLHQRILNSATYQQTSIHQSIQASQIDPANRLLWRMNPRRLSGEELVDSLSAASGALPLQRKRMIYEPVMRNGLHPVASLFDFPDRIRSVSERHNTTTSTQSLLLMNSPWMKKQAESILAGLGSDEALPFIHATYKRLLARHPQPWEVEVAQQFLGQYAQSIAATSDGSSDDQGTHQVERAKLALVHSLICSNPFLYID